MSKNPHQNRESPNIINMSILTKFNVFGLIVKAKNMWQYYLLVYICGYLQL